MGKTRIIFVLLLMIILSCNYMYGQHKKGDQVKIGNKYYTLYTGPLSVKPTADGLIINNVKYEPIILDGKYWWAKHTLTVVANNSHIATVGSSQKSPSQVQKSTSTSTPRPSSQVQRETVDTYSQPQPQTKNYINGNSDLSVFLEDDYKGISNYLRCINYSGRPIKVYVSYTKKLYDSSGNLLDSRNVSFQETTVNESQIKQNVGSAYMTRSSSRAGDYSRITSFKVEKYIVY